MTALILVAAFAAGLVLGWAAWLVKAWLRDRRRECRPLSERLHVDGGAPKEWGR